MNIKKNIKKIKTETNGTQLVVVTKKQSLDKIITAYNSGEREFGENRVQDILFKKDKLPNDIKWHMIGHLQTNKVKLIIPHIHMIQSVDSIKLLNIINEYAKKYNKTINCLIQIKIAQEKTKYGFNIKDAKQLLSSNYEAKYPYIKIQGLMGMASFTNDASVLEKEFKKIKIIYDRLKTKNNILSIGMSNDYKMAYKSGSTMIRIGSLIFK